MDYWLSRAPQRYNLEIRYRDGVWGQGLRTLQPHESVTIDIGSLQRRQTPDRQGRTIPVTATRGQVHWSIGGGGTARGIVGRIEHVDLALGVSSAYACPQATNDIFVDAWIDPDLQTIAVGDSELYVAWEQDEDAWGGGLQSPYEITDILSWQSSNTSVAVIVSVGSDVAEVGGVANGFTGIQATGASNGWAEYDPSGEEPENHVPIDIFANANVQQCPGDTTRSAIRQEYVDHQQGHTNFFAGGLPSCSDFTSSRQSVYFSFNEINTGDYSVALVRAPLIASASTGYGLDKWRQNYGSARIINSAFRNPVRNTAVNGAPGDSVPGSGHSGSRHMYGDAADLRNETAGGGGDPNDPNDPANAARYAEWTAMITAAQNAGADWLEDETGPCKLACGHADWRGHGGGYQ